MFYAAALLFALQPVVHAQSFNYRLFTAADGLPGGSSGLLFQDSFGYLWIGSCNGLSRFDGKAFTNYGLEDGLPSLCNNMMLEDTAHSIWGISNLNGYQEPIKFCDGKFIAAPFRSADSVSYVFSLSLAPGNKIHAATAQGLFELDNNTWRKISPLAKAPGQSTRQEITWKGHGTVYNFYNRLVLKQPDGTMVTIADTTSCPWYNTAVVYGNKLLITGSNKLFIFDEQGLNPVYDELVKGQRIFAAMPDDKGRMWISLANDGIAVTDGTTTAWFKEADGLPHNLNFDIKQDREGNVWLGNFKGLVMLRPSYVQKINKQDNLASDDVRSLFKSSNGTIFFGHADAGFSIMQQGSITPASALLTKQSLQQLGSIVTDFAEDIQHRLWITTSAGKLLRYFDGHTEEIALPSQASINALQFNRHDSCVYVATDTGLYRFKDKSPEKIKVIIHNRPAVLQRMFFDHQNQLWIVTGTNELGIYEMSSSHFYPVNPAIGNAAIQKITEDNQHHIWLATNGGGVLQLSVDKDYKTTTTLLLNRKTGLRDDAVQDIVFGTGDDLWIVGSGGLTRAYMHKKNNEGNTLCQHFDHIDGIDAKSFTDASLVMDGNKNLLLGTSDGAFLLDTKRIYTDTIAPLIQIEKVSIDDTLGWSSYTTAYSSYFHLPVQPVLPYNRNNLTIYYNAIAFSGSEEIEYSYMLGGLDTAWSLPTKNTYISLTNLTAGEYSFRVKARRKNYGWSNETVFSFAITPPFWETWWFRLVSVLAASGLLTYLFRLRLQQVRNKTMLEQQLKDLELKALKAQMNPHFIYNAMNSIQALVMNDEPEKAVRYLGKFARLLRQVLENSDKSWISLEQELAALQLYVEVEALRFHKDFDYSLQLDENIVPGDELVPPFVLQPYAENALWHGLSDKQGERRLSVNVALRNDELVFRVTDNGIGRAKAAQLKSKTNFGLSRGMDITRRRLSLMNNAAVIIEDLYDDKGEPAGTSVSFSLPRNPVTE